MSVAVSLLCAWASVAGAQPIYTGQFTGHLGGVFSGDVRDGTLAGGASIAVLDAEGLGAELDLAHSGDYDGRFADSSLTSLMVNLMGVLPAPRIRPFAVVGVGLIRIRAEGSATAPDASRTDFGFNAGGGLSYVVNDAVALRGDVRYLRFLRNHPDIDPIAAGRFDYWRASVGATYSWPLR